MKHHALRRVLCSLTLQHTLHHPIIAFVLVLSHPPLICGVTTLPVTWAQIYTLNVHSSLELLTEHDWMILSLWP
jgi:hypothetical protein